MHAVFAIMARKDAGGVVAALRDVVDIWHLLELDDPDARRVDDLRALLGAAGARDRRLRARSDVDGGGGPSQPCR
ncbi:MAG: hypothetical protein U5L11_05455 [Arhodomonas sp.]|nr:hypothetical protein [Arhodomonas sp.]